MSFVFNGLTIQGEITVSYEQWPENAVTSEPTSGEYRIKKLRLDTDGKTIMVTHDDTPEA